MAVFTVGRFLWGTNFENIIEHGWPLDNVVCGRRPRAGSDWVVSPGGVEDSWITGFDYEMTASLRWIPRANTTTPVVQTGWAGSTGVQAFLDWARAKNTFRYVPDINAPLFYVDGCYLEAPMADPGAVEPDGTWSISFTLRNPTFDFALAIRGVMFEYSPGADISGLGLNGTFTNAGVSGFLDNTGFFESAAINQLKDRHYPNGLTGGAPVLPRTTLLQPAATNKLTAPEDLSNAAWTKVQATIPSINNPSPRGGDLTASFLREDASVGVFHYCTQSFTIAVAGNKVGGTRFVKANGRTKLQWLIGKSDLSTFFSVIIDTVAGTITPSVAGSGVVIFSQITPLVNGYYMVQMYGTVDNATTAIVDQNYLMSGSSTSYTGDGASGMFVWGCVATDNTPAGVYWGTGASRSAASLSFPFPHKPQAMFIFVDFIEQGSAYIAAAARGVLSIVDSPNAANGPALLGSGSNGYRADNGCVVNSLSEITSQVPVAGDRVQLLSIIRSDGSVQLRESINLAADLVGAQSAVGTFLSAFAGPLWIGALGTTNVGENAHIQVKIGPLTFGGVTIDTIAKARAA